MAAKNKTLESAPQLVRMTDGVQTITVNVADAPHFALMVKRGFEVVEIHAKGRFMPPDEALEAISEIVKKAEAGDKVAMEQQLALNMSALRVLGVLPEEA